MTSKKDPIKGFRSARQERLSRRQKEQRKQRVAMGLIASFIILVLGIVLYGYVTTFVLPPRQVIVRVDDTKYTMGDMIQVLRMMQRGSEFFGQKMDLSTVPFQVPLSLAQREIIARAVPRFNINVTEDQIDDEIRLRLLPNVAEGQEVAEEQLEREFKERYRQYLNAIQFSEEEYRVMVLADIERDLLREIVGQDVPRIAEQIHVNAIAMPDLGELEILKSKFADGTNWKQLVREFNQDPQLANSDGDLGWTPRGVVPELDEFLFGLEIGKLSEPMSEQNGQVVYMISEKADAREIDYDDRESLKTHALQEWLDEQWDKYDIETNFTSDDYAWVTKQLGISTILQAQGQS